MSAPALVSAPPAPMLAVVGSGRRRLLRLAAGALLGLALATGLVLARGSGPAPLRLTGGGIEATVGLDGARLSLPEGEVRLETVARDGRALTRAEPRTEGRRITADRGGVEEWFVPAADGIQQGWTVARPGATGDLVLTVAVAGLQPVAATPDEVLLHDAMGTPVARYDRLVAWDAEGRDLPAALTVDDRTIEVRVDTAAAVWPVTVDPVLARLEPTRRDQELLPPLPQASEDPVVRGAGSAVALAGDVLVVGAPGSPGGATGYVLVYEREGLRWERTALFRQGNDTFADGYGASVDTDGTTIIVGNPEDGVVEVVERNDDGEWTERTNLEPSNPEFSPAAIQFGAAVAIEGVTAIVGAPDMSMNSTNFGVVTAYTNVDGDWDTAEVEDLRFPEPEGAGDSIGSWGAALDLDGVALVGAPESERGSSTGAAFRVTPKPGSPTPWKEATLAELAPPAEGADDFGAAVAVRGGTAIVGAPSTQSMGAWYAYDISDTPTLRRTEVGDADDGELGASVALSDTYLLVGEPSALNADGRTFVYRRAASGGAIPISATRVLALPAGGLGRAVAADGDAYAAGAPAYGQSNGEFVEQTGAAVVSIPAEILLPAAAQSSAATGQAAALDGDTLVLSFADTAVVWERRDGVWEEVGPAPVSSMGGDSTVAAVALEGGLLAVGRPEALDSGEGAVTIYRVTSGGSAEIDTLFGPEGFGSSLDLDQGSLVVGSPSSQEGGRIDLYDFDGGTFVFTDFFTSQLQGDRLGQAVAVDGNRLVAGAPGQDSLAGAVRTFRIEAGTLIEETILLDPDRSPDQRFGQAVDVDASAGRALVGAPGDGDSVPGSALTYVRDAGGGWMLEQRVVTESDGVRAPGVAVGLDGELAAVGVPSSAQVLLFERQGGGAFTDAGSVTPADRGQQSDFGSALDLDGDELLVGDPGDDTDAVAGGAGYVYRLVELDAGGPYTVAQGGSVGLAGTLEGGTSGITVTWDLDGDGLFGETGDEAANGDEVGLTPTFVAAGLPPGQRTVTVRATDGQQTVTDTAVITVTQAPTASPSPSPSPGALAVTVAPTRADEGSAITLSATVSNARGTPVVDWDLDGDGAFGEAGTEQSVRPVVPAGNGPGLLDVAARVRDDGRSATTRQTIQVDNVAPTADAGGPYSIDLGDRVTATATATDPFDTVLDFDWDLDEDGSFDDWTLPEVTFQPARGGTFQARVRVDDREGGVTTAPALVRVIDPNSPPADLSITLAGDPASAPVGEPVAVVATITNAGPEVAPETLSFIDVPPVLADATAPGCDDSGDSLRCELGDLAVGETAQLRVTGTVASAEAGQVLATVGAAAVDPDLSDNEARLLVGETEAVARARVQRLGGADRLATAIAISRAGFGDGAAAGVVLARADLFADALSGTPLAVQRRAPILLTPVDQLAPPVEEELQRLLPPGGTVTLLGGTAALAPAVASAVTELGYQVDRVAGSDRFATAGAIAERLTGVTTLLVADGNGFPDALAAGAVANGANGAVLLTAGATVPPATTLALQAHPEATLYAIGGAASRALPTALPVVGATRIETAIAVADTFATEPAVAGVASGFAFPDALAGGVLVSRGGGPMLLSGTDELAGPTGAYLAQHAGTLQQVYLFGGTAALAPAVEEATRVAVGAG